MNKSRNIAVAIVMAISSIALHAQQPINIDLWPNGLPNTNGIDQTQPYDDSKSNFKPSVRVFLPEKPDGRAVIALPGGGYGHLAMDHEGYDWAPFFNEQGIALIVLKYRMPRNNKEVPMSDVREAFRVVRSHAKEWKINPAKVGIMGSSAGGHLASTIATHTPKAEAPAFQILFYPVISMDKEKSHAGSCINFLSKNPTQKEIDLYSNQLQVNSTTPPAIVLLSTDDKAVPPSNGIGYVNNMIKAKASATLLTFPTGGHGWGIRDNFAYKQEMLDNLRVWLENL